VDLIACVREWGNGLTGLVGQGKPLALGFHEHRLRSPQRGVYALVAADPSADGGDAEGTLTVGECTFNIYSVTDAAAARKAGIALIAALRAVNAAPPAALVTSGTKLVVVSGVSGQATDAANASTSSEDEPLYVVRATVYASPA
jgi:hypothetical protein